MSRMPRRSPSVSAFREGARSGARRRVTLPCQAVREHDFKLVADRILDVSVEGALLPLRIPVLTGESVIVSFEIPGTWIDVEATVARVVHGRRPDDDGLAVGVLFDRISPAAKAALAAYLHGRAPASRRTRAVAPSIMPAPRSPVVDGLGILRAVVSAWQDLGTTP